MSPKLLLDLATGLLREVLAFEAPADAVVAAWGRRERALGPRERHALAEMVFAVLRRRRCFEHFAREAAGAVDAAVPAEAGRLRRLAILGWPDDAGLLRGAMTPAEQAWRETALHTAPSGLAPALRHNLPDWLAQALTTQLGEPDFWALVASLDRPAPLDLRVNLLRARREAVQAALQAEGVVSAPTPWSPWGLRVVGKPALARTAPLRAGDVEVQDEGSQLLALLVGARRGDTVVDFCAGAGGKTLALGSAMRGTGRLYAFDTAGHRLDALKPRLARSGLGNVYTAAIAHERDERVLRLAGKVDRVLVDAPCSGLGTLRRSPDLKWRLSPQAVAAHAVQQAAILDAAATLPKAGGRLVYATCSLLAAENEEVAAAFEAAHPEYRRLDAPALLAKATQTADAAAFGSGDWLRLWPYRHETDGFFAATWERS